jgi:hypothetical protein
VTPYNYEVYISEDIVYIGEDINIEGDPASFEESMRSPDSSEGHDHRRRNEVNEWQPGLGLGRTS